MIVGFVAAALLPLIAMIVIIALGAYGHAKHLKFHARNGKIYCSGKHFTKEQIEKDWKRVK